MKWKKKYGNVNFANIDGINFYFRDIKRTEYETLKNIYDDSLVIDEKIAEMCVLDPQVEDWSNDTYAGYPSTIARIILEESLETKKPNQPDNYLQGLINMEYNKVANDFGKQMPAIIIRAFPAYKIEEIEMMSLKKQIELYAQAMWVLNEIEPNPYYIGFAEEEKE